MLKDAPEARAPAGGVPAGFFDVDGTLGSTNVVTAYLHFLLHGATRFQRWARAALLVPGLPYYAVLDMFSRERFIEVFHRRYANVSRSELQRWATEAGELFWRPRLYPKALQQIEWHRSKGHNVVLISGGLKPVLEPLLTIVKPDRLVAAQPETRDGRLTGKLIDGVLSGPRKARAAHDVARALGVDMAQSYAYGDSHADLELLESVGHPVAVNPDRRLRGESTRRGWPVRTWRHV